MAKKYIDAERLIKKFEKMIDDIPASVDSGAGYVIDEVYKIIDSLQQEQPEVDLEKEIDACWQNWLSPSNQKEVEGVLPKTEFATYARHFYGLGGINARKEEQK